MQKEGFRAQQQNHFRHRIHHIALSHKCIYFSLIAAVAVSRKTGDISHQRTGCTSLEVEDHGWLSAEQSIFYQSFNHVQVCLTLSTLRRRRINRLLSDDKLICVVAGHYGHKLGLLFNFYV